MSLIPKALRHFIVTMLCLLSSATGLKASNIDEIIDRLDYTIDHRDVHFTRHQLEIDSLKRLLYSPEPKSKERFYQLYNQLFNEYKSYQFDSASVYIQKQAALADELGDYDKIVETRTDMLYNTLSTGIFTDALDIARNTDLSKASPQLRAAFYYQCIRLYSDLSNFADNNDIFDENMALSKAYSDSVVSLMPQGSFLAAYASIFCTDEPSISDRIKIFDGIMADEHVSKADKATVSSILGDLHLQNNQSDSAMYYKALSSILDIEAGKRETRSKYDMALYMYTRGDLDRADRYINVALEDANFFNSRMRKMEICNILPYIDTARYEHVSDQRTRLWWVVAIVSALSIALLIAISHSLRQMRRLHSAQKVIQERNAEIEQRNREIEQQNSELQSTISKLRESNKIKDEYIGYGFYVNSEYLRKMEQIYKLVNHKLAARQYDDLRMTFKESSLRKEKETMHEEFDRTFLRIFPSFISQFNALFPPEEASPENAGLTSEMRIFALIRLGITDSAIIAQFLNYSVNTINTYKTKTKNRSHIPNDQFEQKIMDIKSVS